MPPAATAWVWAGSGGCLYQPGGGCGGWPEASAAGAAAAMASRAPASPARAAARRRTWRMGFMTISLGSCLIGHVPLWAAVLGVRYPMFYGCPADVAGRNVRPIQE